MRSEREIRDMIQTLSEREEIALDKARDAADQSDEVENERQQRIARRARARYQILDWVLDGERPVN